VVLAASPNSKLDLLSTHTRLWCRPYERRWSVPVDLPLLVSQTKYDTSLAAVDAELDNGTHDMVAQSGAGGIPKLDLLSTQTRLWCRPYERRWSVPVDLPLLVSQTKYNRSLEAVDAEVDSATNDMVAQSGASGKPKLDLLSTYAHEVVVSALREKMV
jgi:outer membrane lipopolysaccharide assembly protein LptE/RlpB